MSKQLYEKLITTYGEQITTVECLLELEKVGKEVSKEIKNKNNDLKYQLAKAEIAIAKLVIMYSDIIHNKLLRDKKNAQDFTDWKLATGYIE